MTKVSSATALVALAHELYTMRQASDGTVFAVPRKGARLTYPLRGGRTSLRSTLAREYFKREKTAASQQALSDALAVLEVRARTSPLSRCTYVPPSTPAPTGSTSATRPPRRYASRRAGGRYWTSVRRCSAGRP